MAFLKLLCHRDQRSHPRKAQPSTQKNTVSTDLSILNTKSDHETESTEYDTRQSILGHYFSMSAKRRFSVKSKFRRVKPARSSQSESISTACIDTPRSLPLLQPSDADFLSRSKSTMFPSTSELQNTPSTQSNLLAAFQTDISQSQSSCSYFLKKQKDEAPYEVINKQYSGLNESTKSSKDLTHRGRDTSESKELPSSTKLLDFLSLHSKDISSTRRKLDKSLSSGHGKLHHHLEKHPEKLNFVGSAENRNSRIMDSYISFANQRSSFHAEKKSNDTENTDARENTDDTEWIDSNRRSVFVATASVEGLPKCECPNITGSSDRKKKAFFDYERQYRKFLIKEAYQNSTKEKALVIAKSHKASPKGEEKIVSIIRMVNQGIITTTGCPLCDANQLSQPRDAETHIVSSRGDVFNRRYIVLEERGRGTFGKVFECLDVSAPQANVAVKVVRATKKYSSSARIEASVLRYIQKKDRFQTQPVVHLLSAFFHFDHVCLVFPLMGPSLYAYMKISKVPFSLANIKSFAYQILKAVKFLHKIGLTHTDLKPENVLLVNPKTTISAHRRRDVDDTRVCIIDLGSATFHFEKQPSLISTRHYRAPEVVLQIGWSFPCDIWSIGCVLLELYTGYVFFRTHDNQEHLQMMERAFGRFPMNMVKCTKTNYFLKGFVKDSGKQRITTFQPLDAHMRNNNPETSRFRHLLRQLMTLDPSRRISADAACKLAFFRTVRTGSSPEPESEPHCTGGSPPVSGSSSQTASSLAASQKSFLLEAINVTNLLRPKGERPAVRTKPDGSSDWTSSSRKPKQLSPDSSDGLPASPEPIYNLSFVTSPKVDFETEEGPPESPRIVISSRC